MIDLDLLFRCEAVSKRNAIARLIVSSARLLRSVLHQQNVHTYLRFHFSKSTLVFMSLSLNSYSSRLHYVRYYENPSIKHVSNKCRVLTTVCIAQHHYKIFKCSQYSNNLCFSPFYGVSMHIVLLPVRHHRPRRCRCFDDQQCDIGSNGCLTLCRLL